MDTEETAGHAQQPLSNAEARVLGCLMEKEFTTPEYYPMTLNALVNACNQRSNRNPVMELDDEEVDSALESLRFKHLVFRVSQAGARVAKFKHSIEQVYPTLTTGQRAILTELILRGPQTAGELRGRCERMSPFADIPAVKSALQRLAHETTPLAIELPRQPGKKDARHAHLLAGEPEVETSGMAEPTPGPTQSAAPALTPETAQRIEALEERLKLQEEQIQALQNEFDRFRAQFE